MTYPYQHDPTQHSLPTTSDERTWAVIGHISTLVAALLSVGWLSIVGPFVVWALNKDKSRLVRESAAGAFNFNLVIWIMTVAGWVFAFTVIGLPVAIVLWAVAFVAAVYCHVKGAVLANRGELYRYPWGITVLR